MNAKIKSEICFWIVFTILVFGIIYRRQVLEFFAMCIGIGYNVGIKP